MRDKKFRPKALSQGKLATHGGRDFLVFQANVEEDDCAACFSTGPMAFETVADAISQDLTHRFSDRDDFLHDCPREHRCPWETSCTAISSTTHRLERIIAT